MDVTKLKIGDKLRNKFTKDIHEITHVDNRYINEYGSLMYYMENQQVKGWYDEKSLGHIFEPLNTWETVLYDNK